MNAISKLNQSLAQIEKARAQFVATINELQLEPETFGELAHVDDLLAKAEKDFAETIVDLAMASRTAA